ncbi:U32 family peptidase [Methanococcoides seepicolus]|uniref:U32 family peptidase n=1 Tax=Methanococcoides seepicolus TaxID=2828780 RepID=A0A9E4ZGI0_9EURY|nr:U32 family peptidase [Methanococcoides seepicolus]MCM1987166.1 U32 family peptidase [Methanococcoides seepicolus]
MKNDNTVCNTPPEILAPAGDIDALIGAIKGGADAVYFGVTDLNARKGAKNFSVDDLEETIDLLHSHGIKAFLALNIPVKQNELQHALDVVDKAYSLGIDAIILQDLGLLSILHRSNPDLALHASTQMTVHTIEGVNFIANAGAVRVIVSRELEVREIEDIVKNSDVEIEIFVHGALCYSYSGKCLFSSFINDRSANRGACAQPCRRPYVFVVNGRSVNEKITGRFPISCAELCTLSEIGDIVKAGVKSLKIEGRMKRPEYVTESSQAYKQVVEAFCGSEELSEDGVKEFEKDLAKLFYRGFTKGFVLGDRDVAHPKYSSSYGVFLGKISKVKDFRYTTSITLTLGEDIRLKDGVGIHTKVGVLGSAVNKLFDADGEEIKEANKGDTVTLEISSKTGKAVSVGNEVYLTTDQRLLERLQRTRKQGLPVSIEVDASVDEVLKVRVSSASFSAEFVDDFVVQKAQKAPMSKDNIVEVMEKLGDTSFEAKDVDVNINGEIFIPMGVLTNARRQAADMLLEKILASYRREEKHPKLSDMAHFCDDTAAVGSEINVPLLSVEVKNSGALFDAVECGADIVYLPISKFSELLSEEYAEMFRDVKETVEIVVLAPRISHEAELNALVPMFETVKEEGLRIACYTLGQVELARKMSIPFVVQKEFNTFNSYTSDEFYRAGAFRVTLSSELNMDEMKDVADDISCRGKSHQLEAVAHGRELMLITEHDLLKPLIDNGITIEGSEVLLVDSKSDEYPVKRVGERTLIYDSMVIEMLDHVDKFEECGIDVIRLDLSLYGKKDVQEITSAYRRVMDGKDAVIYSKRGSDFTSGHYFKGV